jgi:thiamine biosynthesis lipoprotein
MTSAERSAAIIVQTWPALGTLAVLCITDGSGSAARSASQREIDAIDAAASRFRDDSELSRVNRAGGQWVPISDLLLEALRLAVRAAAITDGAVDPTLGGRLVKLGYDRDWQRLAPVAADEPLDEGAHIPGRRRSLWPSIELAEEPPAVRVPAGLQLDLGATAKALTADRGARAAHLAGGAGALLSLGGDIATCGSAPPGGWSVHVTDDHRSAPSAEGQTVSIASGGLATSSLVPRRWRHDGHAVHHVLDPRTGHPVAPVWRTASVAAATCAEANIASTAALVLGDRAAAWLAESALPARLVRVDGTVETRGGWPR